MIFLFGSTTNNFGMKNQKVVSYICQYCGNTIHDFIGTLNGYFLGNGVIYVF